VKLAVTIPVYNRTKELECCLLCLSRQSCDDFEITICDDGSSEDTLSLVRRFSDEGLDIRYHWQPDRGFRAGQARNAGVRLARGCESLFLDSDIIVQENWVSEYMRLAALFPDAVICGRYDFLLPCDYTVEDVALRFDRVVSNTLPSVKSPPANQLVGPDIRQSLFDRDRRIREEHGDGSRKRLIRGSGGALFGGNALVPETWFGKVGGFDEHFVRHGGEDSDLGQVLDEAGAPFIFTDETIGWHLWHWKNQRANEVSLRANIEYIDRKHGKIT